MSALQEVSSNDDGCSQQSQLTFTATSGTTYRIAIDGADGATGYDELGWGLSPANDDFAQATAIAGDTGTVNGDNWYATEEVGEPEHGGPGGYSVWYRWTAPSSGTATFDVCTAYFDTLLAVYTGDNVGVLTPVAQNDDDCDYASRVSFQATAGVVYNIALDGFYGEQGEFTLQWSQQSVPPRNQASPAILGVATDGATLTATNGEWGGTPPFTFGYSGLDARWTTPTARRSSPRRDHVLPDKRRGRTAGTPVRDRRQRGWVRDRDFGRDGNRFSSRAPERRPAEDRRQALSR